MSKKRKKDMSISEKIVQISAKKQKLKKVNFFRELKEELKKVSWTTKAELTVCTKIVVGAIFVLGIGIYFIDLSLRGILQGMSHLVRMIG